MGGGGINIKKVAEMAGVSVATISRVLNHPEQVTPDTRSHVMAVMKQANYMPNWFARGLSLGRTNTIAVLTPSTDDNTYIKVVSGIETVARSNKFAVILCHTHHSTIIEQEYVQTVMERNVDGVILISSTLDNEQVAQLIEFEIPFIHIGKRKFEHCEHTCYIHYEAGALALTQHVLTHGYERVDLLLGEEESDEAAQVLRGYRQAMETQSGKGKQHTAENTVRGGFVMARRLMEENDLPRALITLSDQQAFGVMKAMQETGVSIPGQMALASMSDSVLGDIVTPPLTSVELPAKRLGVAAARMLFDIIESQGFEPEFPQETTLQPKLKIRSSCGCKAAGFQVED